MLLSKFGMMSNKLLLTCRNPFDISRKELLSHIRRMRMNFIKAALSGIQLQEAGMCFTVIETKLNFTGIPLLTSAGIHIATDVASWLVDEAVSHMGEWWIH